MLSYICGTYNTYLCIVYVCLYLAICIINVLCPNNSILRCVSQKTQISVFIIVFIKPQKLISSIMNKYTVVYLCIWLIAMRMDKLWVYTTWMNFTKKPEQKKLDTKESTIYIQFIFKNIFKKCIVVLEVRTVANFWWLEVKEGSSGVPIMYYFLI